MMPLSTNTPVFKSAADAKIDVARHTRARIAHIVPTDKIAYTLLRGQLSRLQEADFQVTVVCGDVGYGDELRACGFDVLHIPFAREIEPLVDFRCAAALFATLRRHRFDIVHSHNPKGGLLGPVIARLAQVPLVVHTVHGFLFNENSRGLHGLLAHCAERWTAAWSEQLLFQSAEDYEYARAKNYKGMYALHLVGNGIDPHLFDPLGQREPGRLMRERLAISADHTVIGTVGRFVEEKGFLEFFEMAACIASELDGVRFLVAGSVEHDQSDAIDLRALASKHGILDRCKILEPQIVTPAVYASMDIFVLASYREGISRSLLEAGAMSLPLIASDIRGCREFVEEGVNGMLFPLKKADDLVVAVRRLVADRDMRQRMGAAARQRVVESYTEQLASDRVAKCYEKMLAAIGR